MDILRRRIYRRNHEIINILIVLLILFLLLFIVRYTLKITKKNDTIAENIHVQNEWLSIRDYKISIELDPINYSFKAKVTISIKSKKNNLRELFFFFAKLDDIEIKCQGEEQKYISTDKFIKVILNKPLENFETKNLTFTYRARIGYFTGESGRGNIVSPSGAFLSYSSGWYPYIPNSKAKAKIIYRVPPANFVVSSGKLLSHLQREESEIFVYEILKPTHKYSFAVRNYQKESVHYEDLKINLFHYNLSIDETRIYISKIIDYISYLSRSIAPLSYKLINIVQTPNINIETDDDFSLISISDDLFLEDKGKFENKMAYKIGKQWFGNMINCDPEIDYLICKALPEYLYYKYLEDTGRDLDAKLHLEKKRSLYFFLKKIYGRDASLNRTTNIHYILTRGFYSIHSLRFILEDKFPQFLKSVNLNFRNKIVTYNDILELLREYYADDLRSFIDFNNQSCETIDFELTFEKYRKRRLYYAEVNVKKSGFFDKIPLEISINTEHGKRVERVMIKERVKNYKFTYDDEPFEALADPNFHYLREDGNFKLKTNELNVIEVINAFKKTINERDTTFIEPFVTKDFSRFEIFREMEILIAAGKLSFLSDDLFVLSRDKRKKEISVIIPFTLENNNMDTILFTLVSEKDRWEIVDIQRGIF